MDEQAKIILYKQLMKFEEISKMEEKLIDGGEFLELEAKEILKYALLYRDKALEIIKKSKDYEQKKNEFYLELPNINLEGEDLSDVYLHMFMAGFAKERNNGKKIFITTNINLKDTNCTINLATIRPIIVSEDGINIKEMIADIKKCDFRGCIVFGKFQNTKARLDYTDENLPMEYIRRLETFKVPKNAVLTTDYVYLDMLERKHVKGTNGLNKVKQMVDFDLTDLKNDIFKYRDVIKENKMDISFTGAFIYVYGLKSVGQENIYMDLEGRAKEEYKAGNMEYVEAVFEELDKETKKNLVTLALREGKIDFVSKHEKELSNVQKKYLEKQKEEIKAQAQEQNTKELLRQAYSEGRAMDLEADLMAVNITTRSDIIEEIYEKGDLDFVEHYLNKIERRLKNKIIQKEYSAGNEKFINRNFSKIEEGQIKEDIINKQLKNKNVDFLCKNYSSIKDEQIKNKIQELAFQNGKVRFLKKYFEELPRNMQIEAAIKFQDLGISEEVMADLLKK